jgi:hypothetical protein
MRELHTIQAPIPTTPAMRAARMVQDSVVGYGLGWQIMDYRGHPIHWHSGNGNGTIAYMAILPRDRLGAVVLVNTWMAPLVHGAIMSRILDAYLGYEPRDWAGEAFPRQAAEAAAQDSNAREMEAMQKTAGTPPLPLKSYVGRYEHPVFGPLIVRLTHRGLVLQLGEGQLADLVYHGGDRFYTRWWDSFDREYFGTHAEFPSASGRVDSLKIRLNRDEFVALRSR